jgi:hypothetical protein
LKSDFRLPAAFSLGRFKSFTTSLSRLLSEAHANQPFASPTLTLTPNLVPDEYHAGKSTIQADGLENYYEKNR